jgi:NAD(P)-dependent dehydrogenase (short-subunit alcohol dehydrogenase family)
MPDASSVAVVTGAGSGLGLECALHLAASGWNVSGAVLTAQEEENLRGQCQARSVTVRPFRMDVTDEAQVRSGIASVIAAAGRIDALVQFAGLGLRGFFEDLDDDEIRRVFDVNVFGMMNVTRAVLPYMRQARSGRIVITSSVAGRMPSMSIGGYASSKFAAEGFAECLRQEVYPFGIRVSLLEPGLIATPHFTVNRNRGRRAVDPASPYYAWFCQHEKLVDRILARRSFTAADVARQVERILCARQPKLRYVVGWKAKLVFTLRRYIPGEWFQELYWGFVRRIVTRPKDPVSTLSGSESNEFSRSSRAHAGRQ